MNKFVSSLLGAFTGTWIAFFLIGFFIFFSGIFILSSVSFSAGTAGIDHGSILRINLSGPITDKPYNKSIQELIESRQQQDNNNLHEILSAIDEAATNDNIEGIYLDCGTDAGYTIGAATSSEIRDALVKFKKESGKWVYAYGHSFSQNGYYIASVADSVFINPAGQLDLHGLTSTTLFYKGLLDKLGIDVQIIRVGTYKSAVEPFFRTSMSDASKRQTQMFISNIWDNFCSGIAESRGVGIETIKIYADSLYSFQPPEIAKRHKLVDGICYQHQFESKLHKLVGTSPETGKLAFVSPAQVSAAAMAIPEYGNRIAVLYAEGEIGVSGGKNSINSEDIVPEIIDLANDDAIKGLVLRVNSPGGSAYASEQIWEALEYFKSKKKPFAVSMGNHAASGGYYISCGADRIFAEPVTITGSIGIFGMIPSFKNLMDDKLGITSDFVTTSPNANLSVLEPLTPYQLNAIQQSVNHGYDLFVSRCAQGRKLSTDSIRAIAEGRVWDGSKALEIGLIDQYGNVGDAVKWVAGKAKTGKEYSVVYYPEYKQDFINIIYNSLENSVQMQQTSQDKRISEFILDIRNILNKDKLQCRMEDFYIH